MKVLDIYTDGSQLDKLNKGRLGCSGVAVDFSLPKERQLLDKFSQELTKEYMKVAYFTEDCSNPTAEMMGIYCALVNFKRIIKSYDKVIFHADYIGVKEWLTDNWKIKAPYIQKIKDDIDQEIKNLDMIGKVEFKWVKGHQTFINRDKNPDAYWNSITDKLAKKDEK